MSNEASPFDLPGDTPPEVSKEINDPYDRYLRVLASLDNLRKSKEQEIARVRDQVKADTLREFLPIIDNMERALQAALATSGPEALTEVQRGVRLVVEHAHHVLESAGVRGFESEGKLFAAELMEAVLEVPTNELATGTVVQQLARGYHIGDKLLRPASVSVAVPGEEKE